MITINKLQKNFGEKKAVDIENYIINQGEMLGLVGNNGAGKTTLFRLILDLLKTDAGNVTINDIDVSKSEEWKKFTGTAFSGVRFTTPYSFCPLFSIACASSFAMTPQPALTQFAILFSAFLSTRLILIHLCIRFIDDLTDIHTTAFCPAHSTGDRHLALTVFLLQCSTDRLYH